MTSPVDTKRTEPLPDARTKYLIVGGGITGLSLEQALGAEDYLVCESEADVGGYCRTLKQDGFVWDYSGHFFHFRHPEIEAQLVSRIGASRVRTVERVSNIHYANGLIDFPFQRNIHQLPHAEFLDCLVGLFERPETDPKNFREMLYAKFGAGITDKFLVPYNEKLYATDLSTLDVEAMGRFFPHASVKDIILGFRATNSASYNSTFTYPEGGAIEYVRAIQADVPDERIRLQDRVLAIDLDAKIATTTRGRIHFERVVSAAPFPKFLSLVGADFDPTLYTYNQVLVFNLGFDSKGPKAVHWTYFPERAFSFYRVGYYDNIFDSSRMSLYVELGFPSDRRFSNEDITVLQDRVLADLRAAGIVTTQRLVSSVHLVLDPAYVHITRASQADVIAKKHALALRGAYSIGRYGSWTYCSIEDNIVEARALVASLTRTANT